MHRPCGLFLTGGKCPLCYVGELGPHLPVNRNMPNVGPRVSIYDLSGNLQARVAAEEPHGTGVGQFIAPHGMAVDSHGDMYVGEVAYTSWPASYPTTPKPDYIRCLQKFIKIE